MKHDDFLALKDQFQQLNNKQLCFDIGQIRTLKSILNILNRRCNFILCQHDANDVAI